MNPLRAWRSLLAALIVVSLSTAATAQPSPEPRPDAPPPPAEAPAADRDAAQAEADHEAEQERKKEQVEIGFILLGGIGIMVVFLIAMFLIYSRRFRRQLAAGRSGSQVRDELWYLKHAPPQPPDRPTASDQDPSP